jgi:hypothetical protein
MSGIFVVSDKIPVGQAIEGIRTAVHCLSAEECKDTVWYFPLEAVCDNVAYLVRSARSPGIVVRM